MATGYMTTTTQANLVPEIWAKKIYFSYYQRNYMRNVLDTINVPAGSDTTNFPTIGKLTAEAVTEGTALTGKYITPGQTQLVIDQHYAVPMSISKRLEIQNLFTTQLAGIMQRRAGEALAYQIETALLSLYSSMSQQIVGTDLTADNVLYAKQKIFEAGWAQGSPITLICTPYQYRKLLQFTNIADASAWGNSAPLQQGQIEQYYGIRIIQTGNVPTTSSYYFNIMVASEYALVGIQQDVEFLINKEYDPFKLAKDASASMLYGYVETQDGFGVSLPTTN